MKILIVVAARPNFMKAAPIIAAIQEHNRRVSARDDGRCERPMEPIEYVLVHTGQHYDESMSDAFFRDLNLPQPDVHLGVGSGSHALQTAEVMKAFEPVLSSEKPAIVILVGDVNSTLGCAITAAKTYYDSGLGRPLIAHVEAGLRSFDRAMPEEINRLLTDHLSDLLYVTEESGVRNLRNEGIPSGKIHFVGNTMIDTLLAFRNRAESSTILDCLGLRTPLRLAPVRWDGAGAAGSAGETEAAVRPVRDYALLTLHRPSNVDTRPAIAAIIAGLEELAAEQPVIFPAHPRTQQRLKEFGLKFTSIRETTNPPADSPDPGPPKNGVVLTKPLGYLDFLCLMKHARVVVTDSGGIQEETTCLGVPCVTVRENTERPVTIRKGTNILAGTDSEKIKAAVRGQLSRRRNHQPPPENWDGRAATRIVSSLLQVQIFPEGAPVVEHTTA